MLAFRKERKMKYQADGFFFFPLSIFIRLLPNGAELSAGIHNIYLLI